jgi:hypothetical protein
MVNGALPDAMAAAFAALTIYFSSLCQVLETLWKSSSFHVSITVMCAPVRGVALKQ